MGEDSWGGGGWRWVRGDVVAKARKNFGWIVEKRKKDKH